MPRGRVGVRAKSMEAWSDRLWINDGRTICLPRSISRARHTRFEAPRQEKKKAAPFPERSTGRACAAAVVRGVETRLGLCLKRQELRQRWSSRLSLFTSASSDGRSNWVSSSCTFNPCSVWHYITCCWICVACCSHEAVPSQARWERGIRS